jgi:drug/metabolite transporter (DMT)-like permease
MVKKFIGEYLQWLLLLILALIWGSSFILMKRSLSFFTASELGALRISFAGATVLFFSFKRVKKLTKEDWFWLAFVGIIGNLFPAFLFAKAQTVIDSSLSGILNSTTPIFALLVGLLVFKMRASWVNFAGIILGFIGTVLIILAKNDGKIDFNLQYSALVILATFFYGFNINIIRNKLSKIDSFSIATISLSIIFIPAMLILFFGTDFTQRIMLPPATQAIIYPAILGVVGSAFAIILFNQLVKLAGVLFTASVTYFIPIIASIIGFFDGEIFKPIYFFYILIILFGVFLVNKKPKTST